LQVTGIGFLAVLFLTIFHFDAVNLLAESDVLSDLDWLQLPVCSAQSMIAKRYLGSLWLVSIHNQWYMLAST